MSRANALAHAIFISQGDTENKWHVICQTTAKSDNVMANVTIAKVLITFWIKTNIKVIKRNHFFGCSQRK